jgi:hypothetical protein
MEHLCCPQLISISRLALFSTQVPTLFKGVFAGIRQDTKKDQEVSPLKMLVLPVCVIAALMMPPTSRASADQSGSKEAGGNINATTAEKIKLTKTVFGVLRNTFRTFEVKLGHIPDNFWEDQYLLGLFHTYTNFYISTNAQSLHVSLSGAERVLVEFLVLKGLSGDENFSTGKRVVSLLEEKNPTFERGIQNAIKTLDVMMGTPNKKDPDYLRAKQRMEKWSKLYERLSDKDKAYLGVDQPNFELYSAMFNNLFEDYAVKKWGKRNK